MSLISLPFELLANIITFLEDKSDLRNLCLAHPNVYIPAAQQLWRSPCLLPHVWSIQALVQKPYLSRSVRYLTIGGVRVDGDWTLTPAISRLVVRALRLLNGLRTLTLLGFTEPYVRFNLDSCLFKLSALHVTALAQEDVESLHWHCHLKDLTVTADLTINQETLNAGGLNQVLPQLEKLRTTPEIAAQLVPGRPVRDLVIDLAAMPLEEVSSAWSLSTGPLRSLRLICSRNLPLELLHQCSENLPDLLELGMELGLTGEVQFFRHVVGAGATLNILRNFRCLKKMHFTICSPVGGVTYRTADYCKYFSRWGEACPTLKQVTMDTPSNKVAGSRVIVTYTVWSQNIGNRMPDRYPGRANRW